MEREKKCIGEFDGKCGNDATRWIDFGDVVFATCEACYKRYDAKSRRGTGRSIEAEARLQRNKVS